MIISITILILVLCLPTHLFQHTHVEALRQNIHLQGHSPRS